MFSCGNTVSFSPWTSGLLSCCPLGRHWHETGSKWGWWSMPKSLGHSRERGVNRDIYKNWHPHVEVYDPWRGWGKKGDRTKGERDKKGGNEGREKVSVVKTHSSPWSFQNKTQQKLLFSVTTTQPHPLLSHGFGKWKLLREVDCHKVIFLCLSVLVYLNFSVCVCCPHRVANKTPDFFRIGPCWFPGGEILCYFPSFSPVTTVK